ncbi:MAG: hypothetical protein LBU75_13870 [Desulfovibrio sp.]|nr:hypothetical protein [Desulfovibrio sp.]
MRTPTKQELSVNIQKRVKSFREQAAGNRAPPRPLPLPVGECPQVTPAGKFPEASRQIDMDSALRDLLGAARGEVLVVKTARAGDTFKASKDKFARRWQRRLGAAKIAWGKLTEDELVQSEGHALTLVGLIQERYSVTRGEAVEQVKSFFARTSWI